MSSVPGSLADLEGPCGLYAVKAITCMPENVVIAAFEEAACERDSWNRGFSIFDAVDAIRMMTGEQWIMDNGSCKVRLPDGRATGEPITVRDFMAAAGNATCLLSVNITKAQVSEGHMVAVIRRKMVDSAPGLIVDDVDKVKLCFRPPCNSHSNRPEDCRS